VFGTDIPVFALIQHMRWVWARAIWLDAKVTIIAAAKRPSLGHA
jgi:hypothetical protein